jgi:ribosomal protein S18 acetylase RimI-like enzyme
MSSKVRRAFGRIASSVVRLFRDGHIIIRKASPDDAEDFANLVLVSSPTLFPAIYGEAVAGILERLHREPRNLFSYQHTHVAELSGNRVGMLLGYDWKTRKGNELRTGFLLLMEMKAGFLARLPLLLRSRSVVSRVREKEYYISNIATYSSYQSLGVGTRLMREAEVIARKKGARSLALDVESDNVRAITFYERLGFSMEGESSLRLPDGQTLEFGRMRKEL